MKINWQQQDLHTNEPKADWVLVQCLERDICLLYHQLASYSSIMGDLYYGDVFALPYWESLRIDLPDPEKSKFISEGCLVMLLAMAWEVLDGTGTYLLRNIEAALESVRVLQPEEPDHRRLRDIVLEALQLAANCGNAHGQLEQDSLWVHQRFVRGYFKSWASDFMENDYYGE